MKYSLRSTTDFVGVFGVKSAAPIVLPPQACALAFGAIQDTIIPDLSGRLLQQSFCAFLFGLYDRFILVVFLFIYGGYFR